SQLTPYKAPFELGPFSPPGSKPPPPGNDGLTSSAPYRIDQDWKVTEDIEKDVNSVNTGIDSLIETLGLDPTLLGSVEPEGSMDSSVLISNGLPTDSSIDLNSTGEPPGSEDFFSTYLHNMNDGETGPSLDFSVPEAAAKIPTASSTDTSLFQSSSPDIPKTDDAPVTGASTTTKGRKRKSDGPPNLNEVAMKLYLPSNPRAKKQKK
ncbi:hypothetical protein L218DRAFT_842591, partial [Marasmius fiardii PR-910]